MKTLRKCALPKFIYYETKVMRLPDKRKDKQFTNKDGTASWNRYTKFGVLQTKTSMQKYFGCLRRNKKIIVI